MSAVHCGTFEAETLWRPQHLAILPSLAVPATAEIVAAMDELLFVFTEPGDVLLTAQPVCESLLAYLRTLGFQFHNNATALRSSVVVNTHGRGSDTPSLFQRNVEQRSSVISELCPVGSRLELFATVPYVKEFATTYGLQLTCPTYSVMRVVNTKSYSLKLRGELGLPLIGSIVKDLDSFKQVGARLLEEGGAFLAKDEYGVSGKGNLRIDSIAALERVARYLARQSDSGQDLTFVLEPFLEKTRDFSCQLFIDERGAVDILAIQALENAGLAYGASVHPDSALSSYLDNHRYIGLMERLGKRLYADGYFGHVCIDSMLLKNNDWVPIVEVNPRCSMSLIKHYVDQYLSRAQGTGVFTSLAVNRRENPDYSDILAALRDAQLLFTADRPGGIIPMSAGTLRLQHSASAQRPELGRLYFTAVYSERRSRQELMNALERVLHNLGMVSV